MRSCSWVLVCGVATMLGASAGAGASETQVVSEIRHGSCAPTDDGLGPCCFPSEGVASSDNGGCGTNSQAFALWRDYCQEKACQGAGTCRGAVVQMPRVQPRAMLNPMTPRHVTCRACARRTPIQWLRDVLGWSGSDGASCGSCGCGQVSMPMAPEPEVGPTPVVEDEPNSGSPPKPSFVGPDTSPDPSLPVDGAPNPAPKPNEEQPAVPLTQATESPAAKSPDKANTEPSPPMLDAPAPADVIPNQQTEPEKAVEPAAPQATPSPPEVPEQETPPAVPENVLPPASGPAATPVSYPHDVRRTVPVRKATRLGDYIRVR